MNRTMINSAVSMHALQQKLDMIANNIANMNTAGYKRQDASFQDVLTTTLNQHPHMDQLQGRHTSPGLTLGGGARLSGYRTDLTQGALTQTSNPLDLAIEGRAMFEIAVPLFDANGEPVTDENGDVVQQALWTRNEPFQLSVISEEASMLTTSEGYPVRGIDNQPIIIPRNAEMKIDAAGEVTYTNDDGTTGYAGQIKVMRVLRPELLTSIGGNLYNVAANVQDPNNVMQQVDFAFGDGEGIAVRQFYKEQSNVDLTSEMTELIMVQRAFQLNSRALSAGDTMMNLANQLRR